MIYVRVEIWPGGDRARASLLGEATIANVTGARNAPKADYRFAICGKGGRFLSDGGIRDFPRRTHLAWDLLLRVLWTARGHRNRVNRETV
jgi:hypothetical protein